MKRRKIMLFLLAVISSGAIKAEVKNQNEIMVIGSYFNFYNNSFHTREHKNSTPDPDVNPDSDDPIPDPFPLPEPIPPIPDPEPEPTPEPDPVFVDPFPVVKEDGIVVAEKNIVGKLLNYNVTGNIVSNGLAALWMTDKNTNVFNYHTLESINNNFTVEVEGQAHFENNGTVLGNAGGVVVSGGSSILNNGTIKNSGNFGIVVHESSSEAVNGQSGIIQNSGMAGIYVESDASAVNMGTIKNGSDYAFYVKDAGSLGINDVTGIIENAGHKGMYAENGGKVINYGLIRNRDCWGMLANGLGSEAVNEVGGIVRNGTYHTPYYFDISGIQASNGARAINKGTVENLGQYGMAASGTGSEIINETTGVVANTQLSGMYAGAQGKAVNKGLIKNGIIGQANSGQSGMDITGSGSLGINETTGVISNLGYYGMHVLNGGEVINKGKIQNNFSTGIFADGTGTKVTNETTGVIGNAGSNGISLGSGASGVNKGIIENTGSYGVSSSIGTSFINEATGIIKNAGDYGVSTNGATSTVQNYGTISNLGNYGLSITAGTATNNGTISNTGNYGMFVTSGAKVVNNGIIHMTGDNKTGVLVVGSTFTNNGTILMEGHNTIAIKASSNSIVKIASGSEIILKDGAVEDKVTQSNTDFAGKGAANTSANGNFYVLDATSTLINAGTVSSSRLLNIQGDGKFVLDSETGSINTDTLNLGVNLYMSADSTLNSSSDVYTKKNLNVNKITGVGQIVSDSKVFNVNLDEQNNTVFTRNNFQDLFSEDLGLVLEKNYAGSEDNEIQNKVYNSLKTISKDEKLLAANEELTGQATVGNQMNQQYTQDKMINRGIEQILDRRDTSNNGFYVNFLGEKSEVDTKDDSIGYKSDAGGIIIGGMKKIGETTAIGGFVGYLDSHYDYKDAAESSQDTDTWSVTGVVEKKIFDNFKWTTKLGYNLNSNDVNRKITYDDSNKNVRGEFDSWSLGGSTEVEYTQKINDRISLRPSIGAVLDYISQDSYSENGADGLNLNVDSVDALSSKVGIGLAADISAYKSAKHEIKIVPRADYLYELGDPYKDKSVNLAAFSDNMDIWSRNTGKNDLNLGLDLQYEYMEKLTLFAGYNAGVLEDNKTQNINAGFKYVF